jgi:hypothetical protein
MNVKAFKPKIYLMSLSFDLRFLKMNINTLNKSQFCKGLSKDSYNETHLMGKKLRGERHSNHIKKTFMP